MTRIVDILLVDDRPEGIVTLEAILTNPEYNLVTAKSGEEALAKVLTHDFAMILMDVQMPGMDGFETARIIKQRQKSRYIPIIFITAINKSEQYVSTGYSAGAVDYVFKPFDPHILKSKVAIFADLYKKNCLVKEQGEALRESERRDRMRVLTELELEGHRRYQNLADAIPQIVFRASQVGVIDYFNQFWYLYTAKTSQESVGLGWRSVVHTKNLPDIDSKWAESKDARSGFESECRLRNGQNGEYRWHLLRVVPEFNDLSELVCWIGAVTDIHDQKLIQEQLQQAKTMADVASETKSRFLANMSHEIRTPLGIILGFSELLVNVNSNPTERNESIAAIRRNGQQLLKIIDEILDLSKVEAGKMEIELSEISIVDLLNGVKTLLSLSAKEKGLDLQFVINGPIPSRILSNSSRIQQILVNVIGNGIKFTAHGKLTVTISLRRETNDAPSLLHISVKDSGPGLTATQIQNLFQPFAQGDASITRKHGGTGLGLVLSRRLARALGGDITVKETSPGEGCNFEITIETGPVDNMEFITTLDSSKTISSSPLKPGVALEGLKILLVEDSPDNQLLVGRFLTMEGAEVNFANNGVEGIKMAMKGNYDVVLMDIQMPELDGYGAITQLRKQGYKKPIIALTAYGMIEDRKRCFQVGSNDHLTKPVNPSHLIERIYQLSNTDN